MSESDAITQNIANFLSPESITIANAVSLLGVRRFEIVGEPATQEEWDASFINHDPENTVTFEQAYSKYLELRG